MKTFNMVTAILGAAIAVTATGGALANNTIASTVETTGTSTDFTFNGTTLSIDAANSPLPVVATDTDGNKESGYLYFSPLTVATGSATTDGNGAQAFFSGGTFDISTSAVNNGTTGDILSGTFTSTVLSSVNGSTGDVLNLQTNGVDYTGGSYLTEFNTKYGGSGASGNLDLGLSAITPALSQTGGNLNPFSAEGSVTTFDATAGAAAPEPSTIAPFAFGAIGLLGLVFRARRSRTALQAH